MIRYEYRVIPAPQRGQKAKGVKSPEGRFAHAIEQVMNDMAAEGWDYLRAETLPSEERSGFTSTTTTYRNLLVFRRPRPQDAAPFRPQLLEKPAEEEPQPILVPPPATEVPGDDVPPRGMDAEDDDQGDGAAPVPAQRPALGAAASTGGKAPAIGGARRGTVDGDNGVEDTETLDDGFTDMLRRRAAQVKAKGEAAQD